MKAKLRLFWSLLKESAEEWDKDNALRLSAALSYYTIFSLAPLLIIATAIAGLAFGGEAVRGELSSQLTAFLGAEGAKAVQGIVASAQKPTSGVIATITGIVALLVGATGVFTELKSAINQVWGIVPKQSAGIKGFFRDRLLSFAMVACVGFLLLVSLILNTVLAAASKYFATYFPLPGIALPLLYSVVSLLLVITLFALIFKVLPETHVRWRDVWHGAALTGVLFTIGKFIIGLYLGRSGVTSAFGASASVVLILVWTYYSSLILFLGAEFTEVYARRKAAWEKVPPGEAEPRKRNLVGARS
jgi:membrane protein